MKMRKLLTKIWQGPLSHLHLLLRWSLWSITSAPQFHSTDCRKVCVWDMLIVDVSYDSGGKQCYPCNIVCQFDSWQVLLWENWANVAEEKKVNSISSVNLTSLLHTMCLWRSISSKIFNLFFAIKSIIKFQNWSIALFCFICSRTRGMTL